MGKLYLGNQEVTPILYDKESSIGIPMEVSSQGVYQKQTSNFSFSLPSNATKIAEYGLYYAFVKSPGLVSADMSSLTELYTRSPLYAAFYDCPNLTSADFSSLVTVSGDNALENAFYACTSLTSVDFSSLATVSGSNAFKNAFTYSGLVTVTFNALSSITSNMAFNYAFYLCSSLTTLSFPALTTTSFGSYTNQFNNMLQGCTGVTVHFPSAIQSTIGSWSSVTSGFGGTNTTVLFDL